jgi:hypothetical protein
MLDRRTYGVTGVFFVRVRPKTSESAEILSIHNRLWSAFELAHYEHPWNDTVESIKIVHTETGDGMITFTITLEPNEAKLRSGQLRAYENRIAAIYRGLVARLGSMTKLTSESGAKFITTLRIA